MAKYTLIPKRKISKYYKYIVFKGNRIKESFDNKHRAIRFASEINNGVVYKNNKYGLEFIYSD